MLIYILELPKPQLGDLSDLRALSIKVRREKSPNVLGFTHQELCELDSIKVELMPEKKGLILRHVEYEVTSKVSQVMLEYLCVFFKFLSKIQPYLSNIDAGW